MEINIAQGVTRVKFLTTTERPLLRRIHFHVEETTYSEIVSISQHEGMGFAATCRELLALGLRLYRFKQGNLNPSSAPNDKMFYCQVCGQLSKLRYLHIANIMNEEYKFCEDCFFADKYKNFVISQINRM